MKFRSEVDISVIIPCYNSGLYLVEALESLKHSFDLNVEIIIVNDGSTDATTCDLLQNLAKEGYVVINQENKGPAAARNRGVKAANGNFILFLDSDNKIRPTYLNLGVNILNTDKEVGVVYGNVNFFGDSCSPRFAPEEYHLSKMLAGNYIDICAVVRKKMWEDIGGFDEEKIMIGHEDWEFWIKAGLNGWKFYFIDEILYDYRIVDNSLITKAYTSKTFKKKARYVYLKHLNPIIKKFFSFKNIYIICKNDRSFLIYCISRLLLDKEFRKSFFYN